MKIYRLTPAVGAIAIALLAFAVPRGAHLPPSTFWGTFVPAHAVAVERYATLEEMVKSADLVVLARIETIAPGREFGDEADMVHYAAATLEVGTVFSGTLPKGQLTLELQLPHGEGASDVGRYAATAPRSAAVFILRNKGHEAVVRGLSADRVGEEMPYHRLITPGAMVIDAGGKAETVGTDLAYLVELNGSDFSEVLATIGRAAAP